MKRVFKLLILYISLEILLIYPLWIPLGEQSLMEWQREHLTWNYIGVFSNFILFTVYWRLSNRTLKDLGVQVGNWFKHKYLFILVAIVSVSITLTVNYFVFGRHEIEISLSTIIFQLIFVSLGEELFWRGIIQTEYGFWVASILFGLSHFANILVADITVVDALFWALQATVLGMLFGYFRHKTNSVYSSTFLHGIINLSSQLFK